MYLHHEEVDAMTVRFGYRVSCLGWSILCLCLAIVSGASLAQGAGNAEAKPVTLDDAAAGIARSPEAALAWVRDHVSYRPYRGFVRGPKATWWDGAGNAADAAELLAEILRRKKIPTRLAFGTLSDDQVTALLKSVFKSGKYPADVQETLLGEKLADPIADPELRRIAARHVWVQAQWEGAWMDLDPVIPGLEAGQAAARVERTRPKAGRGERRRLRIEVTTTLAGGKPRSALRFEEPLSALVGQRLVFLNQWAGKGQRPRQADPGQLRPVLLVGGRVATGRVYSGRPAATPRSPAGRLGDVFGPTKPKSAPAEAPVEEIVLTYSLLGAGRPERSQRRYLYLAGKDGLDRLDDLTAICVGFGGPPRPVLQQRAAEGARVAAELGQLKARPAPGQERQGAKVFNATLTFAQSVAEWLAVVTDKMLPRLDAAFGTLSDYTDGRVLCVSVSPLRRPALSTDLVFDSVTTWARPGAKVAARAALPGLRGRLEADLEGQALASVLGTQGATGVLTVRSIFKAGQAAGVKPVAICREKKEVLGQVACPPRVRRILSERLDAGGIILVHTKPVRVAGRPQPVMAWYEIDRDTGEWVGVFADGRHAAMTMYKNVKDGAAMLSGWVSTWNFSFIGALATYMGHFFGQITGDLRYMRSIEDIHKDAVKEATDFKWILGGYLEACSVVVGTVTMDARKMGLFWTVGLYMQWSGHQSALNYLKSHAGVPWSGAR
jgi:hypothetical protein